MYYIIEIQTRIRKPYFVTYEVLRLHVDLVVVDYQSIWILVPMMRTDFIVIRKRKKCINIKDRQYDYFHIALSYISNCTYKHKHRARKM